MRREEVVKAIERKEPERIPVWYHWYADQTLAKYGVALHELMSEYSDDLLIASFDPPREWRPRKVGDTEWGVVFKGLEGGAGAQRVEGPLDDWANLDNFLIHQFPDPDGPGRFDRVRQVRSENPDTYVMGHWWFGPFEQMHALRGMEKLFLDFYTNRDKVERLGERLCEYYIGIVRHFSECKVDGVFFSDDWGDQRSLMIGPRMWRESFKPWYKCIFDAIHEGGMHAVLHTCGNVTEILPDLVELGLDVIHPIQPGAMDAKKVVAEFGGAISFFGGVDVQYLLPQGTVEEVEKGLKEVIEIFDGPDGGFLAAPANAITPETPLENIEAMCRTLKECGQRR